MVHNNHDCPTTWGEGVAQIPKGEFHDFLHTKLDRKKGKWALSPNVQLEKRGTLITEGGGENTRARSSKKEWHRDF